VILVYAETFIGSRSRRSQRVAEARTMEFQVAE